MSDRNDTNGAAPLPPERAMSRRRLLRQASLLGAGAVGLGLASCKKRPEDDLVDLTTQPRTLQNGGTIDGTVLGLLTGAVAAGIDIRLIGFGEFKTNDRGQFQVRVQQSGDYAMEFNGRGFARRRTMLRVAGNVSLTESLLETDAGLRMIYLNQYTRGTGPGKTGVEPRTPGATNRWRMPPLIQIYKPLADSNKGVVPDARIDAMRASILALYGPLTANRLGAPMVEVRTDDPPKKFSRVRAGRLVVTQREDGLLGSEHGSSVTDPYDINRGMFTCGVTSTIEVFNRMVAHGLGGYTVTAAFDSILNPEGRATPSDDDLLAATYHYTRSPGTTSPDDAPDGEFINA